MIGGFSVEQGILWGLVARFEVVWKLLGEEIKIQRAN